MQSTLQPHVKALAPPTPSAGAMHDPRASRIPSQPPSPPTSEAEYIPPRSFHDLHIVVQRLSAQQSVSHTLETQFIVTSLPRRIRHHHHRPSTTHNGRPHPPHRLKPNHPLRQRKLRPLALATLLLLAHDSLRPAHPLGPPPRRRHKPVPALRQRADAGLWRAGG